MSRICAVTGRKPMSGNNVAHSHVKTRRRFEPNLSKHRVYVPSENRFIRLKVSSRGLRIIAKLGIEQVLQDMKQRKSEEAK